MTINLVGLQGRRMKIHKIEAAKRQLETAIALFFSNGDPCSIIALAAASEEVLGNYVDGTWVENNEGNVFFRMYKEAINRGLAYKNTREFSQKLVNITKNSLKHANREEEQNVSFNEEETVVRLKNALVNYQVGSGLEFSDPMNRFEAWLKATGLGTCNPTMRSTRTRNKRRFA